MWAHGLFSAVIASIHKVHNHILLPSAIATCIHVIIMAASKYIVRSPQSSHCYHHRVRYFQCACAADHGFFQVPNWYCIGIYGRARSFIIRMLSFQLQLQRVGTSYACAPCRTPIKDESAPLFFTFRSSVLRQSE